MKKLYIVLVFFSVMFNCEAQNTIPDPAFGVNGIVRTDFPESFQYYYHFVRKSMIAPDGSYYLVIELNGQAIITNIKKGGKLNTSYANKGYTLPVKMSPQSAVIQNDGKIIVVGNPISGSADFMLTRYNIDGSLDVSFGVNGIARTPFLYDDINSFAFSQSVIIQEDGKIVAAGYSYTGSVYAFTLARYSKDGILDAGFGTGGKVQSSFVFDGTNFSDFAQSVTVQGDGKIVAAGYSDVNLEFGQSGTVFTIARYNRDGSLDISFDGDGSVQTFFPYEYRVTNTDADATSVIIQSDGKIVAAGYSKTSEGYVFTVARYNGNGDLDAAFDGDGKVQTPFVYDGINTNAFISSVAIQENGKIMTAGYAETGAGNAFTLVRYNRDGSLDDGFDGDGKVQTPFTYDGTNTNASIQSIAIQNNGKILAAGNSYTGTGGAFSIVRYNSNGGLDISLDREGKMTGYISTSNSIFTSATVQDNGKIVAGGYLQTGTGNIFTLARYNSNGSLDVTFSRDGKVQTSFAFNETNISDAKITSVAVQSDEKIIAGGSSYSGSGNAFTLVRYNRNGRLDAGFGQAGKVITPFVYDGANANASIQSLAIQSNGKIVAAGYSNTNSGIIFSLVRYNKNGSLDPGFGLDGKVHTPFLYDGTYSSAFAQSVTVQSDGRILVGGYSYTTSGNVFTLVRYNQNGSLDGGFGQGGIVQTPFLYDGINTDAGVESVTVQNDNKIVAAGYSNTGNGNVFTLARYNQDGSLDAGFGESGKVQTSFAYDGTNSSATAKSVSLQNDGKIVAAGYSNTGVVSALTIVQYNNDGSLDVGFDDDGKAQVVLDNTFIKGGAVIQKNKVYFPGQSLYYGTVAAICTLLLNNGTGVRDTISNMTPTNPPLITESSATGLLEVITTPNPFHKEMRFRIVSPETGLLRVFIYDIKGVQIAELKQAITKDTPVIIPLYLKGPGQSLLFFKAFVNKQSVAGKLVQIN